jgi:hypothetical protein
MYIDNDGLIDHKIFSKTFIAWKEITAADIVWEGAPGGVSLNWILERADKKPYRIYLSHTSKDARILAEALVVKCKGARLSNKILKISEGEKVSVLRD